MDDLIDQAEMALRAVNGCEARTAEERMELIMADGNLRWALKRYRDAPCVELRQRTRGARRRVADMKRRRAQADDASALGRMFSDIALAGLIIVFVAVGAAAMTLLVGWALKAMP